MQPLRPFSPNCRRRGVGDDGLAARLKLTSPASPGHINLSSLPGVQADMIRALDAVYSVEAIALV